MELIFLIPIAIYFISMIASEVIYGGHNELIN